MKKSQYKYQIAELNQVIANLIDRVADLSEENSNLKYTIDLYQKFHQSMLDLVNRDQPKSMKDMAQVIVDHASKNDGGVYSEDEAMDILLKIIG